MPEVLIDLTRWDRSDIKWSSKGTDRKISVNAAKAKVFNIFEKSWITSVTADFVSSALSLALSVGKAPIIRHRRVGHWRANCVRNRPGWPAPSIGTDINSRSEKRKKC